VSRRRLVVFAGAVVVGVLAQAIGPFWGRPLLWVADLVVGVVLIGAGLLAWDRSRASGWLLGLSGLAWFAGTLTPVALLWHRGVLLHLLLTYPEARPRRGWVWAAVIMGYLAAMVPAVWRHGLLTVVLAVALVVAVAARRSDFGGADGLHPRHLRVATLAAALLGLAIAVGEALRTLVPRQDGVLLALFLYQLVIVVIAVLLVNGLRTPEPGRVADIVVELGAGSSGVLRDELARVLGDPSLRLGRWDIDRAVYRDEAGGRVESPHPTDPSRTATLVEQAGGPVALIVHDSAILNDPAVLEGVRMAARLATDHRELQAEVQAQLDAVAASRRRLLLAADDERRRLERRLQDGVGRRLTRLEHLIVDDRGEDRLATARARLHRSQSELGSVAQGLRPHSLDTGGLHGALSDLVAAGPVRVRLDVVPGRFPSEVEVAVYYVCAEALTNAVKHARASAVWITVARKGAEVRVVVTDDGVGGADLARGSGLQGLTDRVQALGGVLRVESTRDRGTRRSATIPLS
jgi:signal transduction histidine kinase